MEKNSLVLDPSSDDFTEAMDYHKVNLLTRHREYIESTLRRNAISLKTGQIIKIHFGEHFTPEDVAILAKLYKDGGWSTIVTSTPYKKGRNISFQMKEKDRYITLKK